MHKLKSKLYTHLHTHTHAHTHTHTYTHTHTHTHTLPWPRWYNISDLTKCWESLLQASALGLLFWFALLSVDWVGFDLEGVPPSSNWFNFDLGTHCFKPLFLNYPWTSQCRASVVFFAFGIMKCWNNVVLLFRPLPSKVPIFPYWV